MPEGCYWCGHREGNYCTQGRKLSIVKGFNLNNIEEAKTKRKQNGDFYGQTCSVFVPRHEKVIFN